jgi:hypothetical protein
MITTTACSIGLHNRCMGDANTTDDSREEAVMVRCECRCHGIPDTRTTDGQPLPDRNRFEDRYDPDQHPDDRHQEKLDSVRADRAAERWGKK